jgi:hypothetical protein
MARANPFSLAFGLPPEYKRLPPCSMAEDMVS